MAHRKQQHLHILITDDDPINRKIEKPAHRESFLEILQELSAFMANNGKKD